MQTTITTELLKKQAKILKSSLESNDIDIPHVTSLNIVSELNGFKNFNAAKALLDASEAEPISKDNEFMAVRRKLIVSGLSLKEAEEGAQWFCNKLHWDDTENIWIFDIDVTFDSLRNFKAKAYQVFLIILSGDIMQRDDISDVLCELDRSDLWQDRFSEIADTDTLMSEEVATLLDLDLKEATSLVRQFAKREIGQLAKA